MSLIFKFLQNFFSPSKSGSIIPPVRILPEIDSKFFSQHCYDFEKGFCTKYVENHPNYVSENMVLVIIFLIILTLYFLLNMLQIFKVERRFFQEIIYHEEFYTDCREIGIRILNRFKTKLVLMHMILFSYYSSEFVYTMKHFYYLKILKNLLLIVFTALSINEIEHLKVNYYDNEKYVDGMSSFQNISLSLKKIIIQVFFYPKNDGIFILQFIALSLFSLLFRSDIIHILIIFYLNLIIFAKVYKFQCNRMNNLYIQSFGFCTIATLFFISDYFNCKLKWFQPVSFLPFFLKRFLSCILQFRLNYTITFFMGNLFLIEYYKYLVSRVMRFKVTAEGFYLLSFIKLDLNMSNFDLELKHLSKYNKNCKTEKSTNAMIRENKAIYELLGIESKQISMDESTNFEIIENENEDDLKKNK